MGVSLAAQSYTVSSQAHVETSETKSTHRYKYSSHFYTYGIRRNKCNTLGELCGHPLLPKGSLVSIIPCALLRFA